MSKIILYLRTDICDEELVSGGSVAHTIGVIKGFQDFGFQLVCASSCLSSALKGLSFQKVVLLSNPSWVKPFRLKINCLFSNLFFFFQIRDLCKKYDISCIYQRYSLLNMTGLLLSWWYKKKLILEYNGSEAWVATHWVQKKRIFSGQWISHVIEEWNVKRADFIVVVSQALKDELKERGVKKERILVNPNGVDTDIFDVKKVQEKRIMA